MRFVSVCDLLGKSSEVWRDLPEEREMVITSNGRPVAMLAAVDESNLEESLLAFRQARAVQAVVGIQGRSDTTGSDTMSMDEIDEEVRAARSERARGDRR